MRFILYGLLLYLWASCMPCAITVHTKIETDDNQLVNNLAINDSAYVIITILHRHHVGNIAGIGYTNTFINHSSQTVRIKKDYVLFQSNNLVYREQMQHTLPTSPDSVYTVYPHDSLQINAWYKCSFRGSYACYNKRIQQDHLQVRLHHIYTNNKEIQTPWMNVVSVVQQKRKS